MFTPPPSPRPSNSQQQVAAVQPSDSTSPTLSPPIIVHAMSSHDRKLRTGRRFKWAVLVVPLVLVLITLSTKYISHPAAFDVVSSSSTREWSNVVAQAKNWRLHKRHPYPNPENDNNFPPSASSKPPSPTPFPVPSTTISSGPSQSTSVLQSIPTIPSAPPILPTPFPQPYDPQLTLNFSSTSCLTFFVNMTQSNAFRPCRAFSLLSQTSADFIDAQSNLTLMNTLIWGTCNTTPGVNQCIANMGWFAETLQKQCEEDLKDKNTLVVDTMIGLGSYKLMYDAACMPNPVSNTYCYMDAVAEPTPADLYLYQLPFGISLPPKTDNLTCSACPKSLLSFYADALSNKTSEGDLTGLKESYEESVQIVNSFCGADYAKTGVVNGAFRLTSGLGGVVIATTILTIWTLVI